MKPHSPAAAADAPPPAYLLSPAQRVALSMAVIVHLVAVCAPAISLATRSPDGPSPTIAPVFATLRPYIDALNLNHAYFFFAPDPGPSHIVRYEVDFNDGRKTITGQFPDRQRFWPRLLYHRHFMLAEALNDRFAPPNDAPEPQRGPDESRRAARVYNRALERWQRSHEEWKGARERYVMLRKSVEQHLLTTFGGSEVRVNRWEHRQPGADDFQYDAVPLDDPSLYTLLPEVSNVETLPWNAPRTP